MFVARELLVIVAPLRLTLWVLAIATAVILVLIALGVSRHFESIRADRPRAHVEAELGPVFSAFLQSQDPERLAAGGPFPAERRFSSTPLRPSLR